MRFAASGEPIATIEYAYGRPPSNPEQRLWNPLGFKEVDFTREPEVLSGDTQPAVVAGGRTQELTSGAVGKGVTQ